MTETPLRSGARRLGGRSRAALAGLAVLVVTLAGWLFVLRSGVDCTLPGVTPERELAFGLTVPGFPSDVSAVRTAGDAVSRRPDVVMWYVAWSTGSDFPAQDAERVRSLGAVPQITWEPWDPAAGPTQQTYPLESIAAGDHDAYLERWAQEVKAYGGPVWLRFAHEMNTVTYPWSELEGRNPAGSYVAAWRHVHEVFRDAGVPNVSWVWSPNTPYDGTTPLADLYPGDDLVDVVALDGYNWDTLQPGTTYSSFEEVFRDGFEELQDLTDKPLIIGETASTEQGGDKGAWVANMFATLRERPEVCGVVWFDLVKETDWRMTSSPGSTAAFREGLAETRSERD